MLLERLSKKHPVLFSTAAILFFWSLGLVPLQRLLELILEPYSAEVAKDGIAQAIGAIGVVILGGWIGLKGRMGFNAPRPWKTVLLGWPFLLFIILNLPENFSFGGDFPSVFATPRPYVLLFFALSVGFIEESLGRGLVCGLLLRHWGNGRKGIYRVALVSGALFGLSHIGNFFMYHYQPLASATQIIFAMFFGVFFFALYYRTGSILPGIAFHALVDLAANIENLLPGTNPIPPSEKIFSRTPESALFAILITLPFFLIGLFLLRKAKYETPANASPAGGPGA